MNKQEPDGNLERLIRAGYNQGVRPNPEMRQRAWQRLKAEWREQFAPASSIEETEPAASAEAKAFLAEPALNRRRQNQGEDSTNAENRRDRFMSKLFTRWGLGLGAAAVAAAIILTLTLSAPKAQGKAAEVMARGARALAKLSSVHFQGQMRSAPQDNFSAIRSEREFVKVELWKQFAPELKWRIDKSGSGDMSGRIAAMDGHSTVLWIKPDYAGKESASGAAFDTDLFQQMAELSDTLMQELAVTKAHGWPVTLAQQTGADGKAKSVITIEAKSGLPDSDYLKNKFFMTADTRRVYTFDNQTELLEGVKIYLRAAGGDELVFELTQIDYNQPFDPGLFQLQLPANVRWEEEMQVLPDNAKYAAMTPEQATRVFLEACGRKDWTEVEKFMSPVTESFKQDRGGIQFLSTGKAFTSAANGAQYVPYEIKFKDGTIMKLNLVLKKDERTGRWFVDGGI